MDLIGNLNNEITLLKKELEELKTSISSQGGEKTENVINRSGLTDDQLLDEIDERQRRATNIVISNIPESQSANVEEKIVDDLNKVKEIIVGTGISTEVVKVFRLGKQLPSKNRLIKVILPTPEVAQKILRNYKFTSNIYLNRDLTQLQQEKSYSVRQEFKNRVQNGEKNIKLKYYNGMPKIIAVKNE